MNAKASVVISTYNKLPRLKLVLYSIECQKIDREVFEVIIINDGSDDGTEQFLSQCEYSFQLKIISTEHTGRAFARNKGIEEAKNDILIFIDDDTVLGADFILNHLKAQRKKLAVYHGLIRENVYVKFFEDPCKGILYPDLLINKKLEKLHSQCVSYEDIRGGEKLHKMSKISAHEQIVHKVFELNRQDWFWIGFCGGNTSINKKWVLDIGGFDEQYGLNWGCEDMDLGYQLMLSGYPFQVNFQAINYHLDHYRRNYIVEHKINMDIFTNKYKDDSLRIFGKFVDGTYKGRDVIRYLQQNTIGEL